MCTDLTQCGAGLLDLPQELLGRLLAKLVRRPPRIAVYRRLPTDARRSLAALVEYASVSKALRAAAMRVAIEVDLELDAHKLLALCQLPRGAEWASCVVSLHIKFWDYTAAGQVGLDQLGPALEQCTRLKHVHAGGGDGCAVCARYCEPALAASRSLTSLKLDGSWPAPVQYPAGLIELVVRVYAEEAPDHLESYLVGLRRCTGLQTLDLSLNSETAAPSCKLRDSMLPGLQLPALRVLTLSLNSETKELDLSWLRRPRTFQLHVQMYCKDKDCEAQLVELSRILKATDELELHVYGDLSDEEQEILGSVQLASCCVAAQKAPALTRLPRAALLEVFFWNQPGKREPDTRTAELDLAAIMQCAGQVEVHMGGGSLKILGCVEGDAPEPWGC